MRESIRAAIVPFFTVLFPAVYFVGRNVTTVRHPPRIEPTVWVIGGALVAAAVGAGVVAAVASVPVRTFVGGRKTTRLGRVLLPDRDALVPFSGFLAVLLAYYLTAAHGLGPDWLVYPLSVAAAPLGLPFLLVAPLAIGSWFWVVLGLMLCPLWLSVVATLTSDRFGSRGESAGPDA